jgi:TonB-linked SusC/RagA family outer membrane protein
MPNMSIYEYDAFGNQTPNFFSPLSNVQGSFFGMDKNKVVGTLNPVAMATYAKFKVLGERVVPRFQVNYSVIKNNVLNAIFDVQFNINNTQNSSFLPQVATGRSNTEILVNRPYNGDVDVFEVTTRTTLAFNPKIKNTDHDFSASLNFLTNDSRSVNQEVETSNTASSLLIDPASASRTPTGRLASGLSQYRTIGAVATANYGFKDKYIFSTSLRGDGSSRFGPAYRYGLFPSGSFAWRVSGENFLKNFKQLDDLKFRLSYALSGNDPGKNYLYFNQYTTYSTNYLGQPGIIPASMELRNLRWETLHGGNTGVNISMFKGRLRSDIDFYRNRTKNLFFKDLNTPATTGFGTINANVGTMDNQGWELAVWTIPYKTKNLSIGFDFNISQNQNIIREISEFYPSTKGNVAGNGDYLRKLQINNPFGSFFGFRYKGVYTDKDATIAKGFNGKPIIGPNGQTIYMRFNYPLIDYTFQPGDAIYEDINNDGNINYMDVVYLGNSNPKLTGGFGPSITWKNLRISSFFSFRYGYDVVNKTKMTTSNMASYDNQNTSVLRRWRKEGDVTDIPRGIIGGGYNWLGSDRYVEDASYVRFRTITARYNFDKKVIGKLKMKSLSAFITAENLLTWTKYTGQDPEVSTRGADPFRVAEDESMTPPSRNFLIGLVTSF